MHIGTVFDSPVVSIDKISMVINFLPLVDREHAYHFLRKLGFLENRFETGDVSEIDTDWTMTVADIFQTATLEDPILCASGISFKGSQKYQYAIQLPHGIHFEFMRNKYVRLIEKIELYGPYRPNDQKRYHSVYETIDTKAQIRLEWNPNNTDISVMKNIFKLIALATGFDPLNDIKITRLDTAVDVPWSIDLTMITSIKNVYQRTDSDNSGGLTKYIGSLSSDRYVRVYDKKTQLKKKKDINHPNKEFYRFESVRQKGLSFLLGEHNKATEDLFSNLAIINTSKLNDCNDLLINAFFDIARLTNTHFDSVVNERMRGEERKKIWRLKKKFRTYTQSEITHPSVIFNEKFPDVWGVFKTNLVSLFGGSPNGTTV